MFSTGLLGLLALCLWSLHKKWRYCTTVLAFGIGLLVVATASGWLPGLLLNALQYEYRNSAPIQEHSSSLLVLLTGGEVRVPGTDQTLPTVMSYARLVKTVQLYRACQYSQSACHILISGGDPKGQGVSEAQTYKALLLTLGVPAQDISCESDSDNTYEEAQNVKLWLQSTSYRQILLITSAYHMKRSVQSFQRMAIRVTPEAADYIKPPSSWLAVNYNLMLMDIAVHEYLGLVALSLNSKLYETWQGFVKDSSAKS